MTELIKKIAEDEALQEQVRACEDAKAFAQLVGMDEEQAEKVFPKVREIMANNRTKLSDDMVDQVSGGCSGSADWGEGPFFQPKDSEQEQTLQNPLKKW